MRHNDPDLKYSRANSISYNNDKICGPHEDAPQSYLRYASTSTPPAVRRDLLEIDSRSTPSPTREQQEAVHRRGSSDNDAHPIVSTEDSQIIDGSPEIYRSVCHEPLDCIRDQVAPVMQLITAREEFPDIPEARSDMSSLSNSSLPEIGVTSPATPGQLPPLFVQEENKFVHVLARSIRYPFSDVRRFYFPDGMVDWKVFVFIVKLLTLLRHFNPFNALKPFGKIV